MATLKELAALVDAEVVGDSGCEIRKVATLDEAGPGEISFLANPKYLPRLASTAASAVIVPPGVSAGDKPLLVCKNPYLAFARILTHLQGQRPAPRGVLPGAVIEPSAELGADVTVYPGCYVGEGVRIGRGGILYPGVVLYAGAVLGEDCLLHAGAVVREECRLGDRVILQPNAVIGSDGFGFAPDGRRYEKIPQVGIVVLEDDVEIGAATCVDRAALGETRIKRGCKLDNLVQIAHNVVVGEDTVFAGQAGVAGSTRIGDHCTVGGQAAISGHISVGDNVTLAGRGGITNNVDGDQVLAGVPAIPHKDWLKAAMSYNKLPEMRKELRALQKRLDELEQLLKED